jgi:hypothetical protein
MTQLLTNLGERATVYPKALLAVAAMNGLSWSLFWFLALS